MTTRFKHLQTTLPPALLEQFCKNVNKRDQFFVKDYLHKPVVNPTIKGILAGAFDWSKTEEGYHFWHDIAYRPWELPNYANDQPAQVHQAPEDTPSEPTPNTTDPFYEALVKYAPKVFTQPVADRIIKLYNPRFLDELTRIDRLNIIKEAIEKSPNAAGVVRQNLLQIAFDWSATEEGHEYWHDIYAGKYLDAYVTDLPAPTTQEYVNTSKVFHQAVADHATDPKPTPDLSDMHREIYTGLIIQDATPYSALIKAGKAVEEYRKYLKEKP